MGCRGVWVGRGGGNGDHGGCHHNHRGGAGSDHCHDDHEHHDHEQHDVYDDVYDDVYADDPSSGPHGDRVRG